MAKHFEVDNMTVQEILELTPDKISKMNKRELSRAVRTVALAANKRINRLKKQAKKAPKSSEDKGYILKKSAKHRVALDALNWVTKDATQSGLFSVGDKSLNQLRSELKRARLFMSMKTSTISGGKEVRQGREERILGYTLEDYEKAAKKEYTKAQKKATGKKPTKAMVASMWKAQIDSYNQTVKDAWSLYRKFVEFEGLPKDSRFRYFGSDELIAMAGSLTLDGTSEGAAIEKMHAKYEAKYIESKDEEAEALANILGESEEDYLEFDN